MDWKAIGQFVGNLAVKGSNQGISFVSKKLVATGTGAFFGPDLVAKIIAQGVSPNVAMVCMTVLFIAYLFAQGMVDYKTAGLAGVATGVRDTISRLRPGIPPQPAPEGVPGEVRRT